jgi:hypothetical protein
MLKVRLISLFDSFVETREPVENKLQGFLVGSNTHRTKGANRFILVCVDVYSQGNQGLDPYVSNNPCLRSLTFQLVITSELQNQASHFQRRFIGVSRVGLEEPLGNDVGNLEAGGYTSRDWRHIVITL